MTDVSYMAEYWDALAGFYEVERERSKRPSLVSTGRYWHSSSSSAAPSSKASWTLQARAYCKPWNFE